MNTMPTVVIAAPSSGSGKTTITTGLIGALRAAGHRVAPFKVGPDYIDPGYHAVAAGRPGRNLDANLVGADLIAPLFVAGARGADIAVVEGVMGLFDGRIAAERDADTAASDAIAHGSTAHVAALLGAPVILVVDASGHSQSMAAVLHGFVGFDSSIRIAGVILNKVGSERHEMVLRQACTRVGLPVVGVVRRDPAMQVPSRHLGLIPAAERRDDAVRAVDAMTTRIGAVLDLSLIADIARTAQPVTTPAWDPGDALDAVGGIDPAVRSGRPVIAVAGGAAFTFGYAEHDELLTAAGAEVVTFDPLIDRLPDAAAGVVVGGGFPEEHAEALSANRSLRTDLAEHARSGRPVHAECAGLLYLATELDGHPMAGVIDAVGRFGPRLTLGYRDAVAITDSVLFPAGARVTGHEFHRSTVEYAGSLPGHGGSRAWGWRDHQGLPTTDGVADGSVHASYLHTHPAAHPDAISRFVAAAQRISSGTQSVERQATRR